jgi:hypothetical protein
MNSRPAHARPVTRRSRRACALIATAMTAGAVLVAAVTGSSSAFAAAPGLGTAAAYSVLGGSTVTNTGSSVLSGDLGVYPGNTTPGFSSATIHGATHAGDAQAAQAKSDLTTAYNSAAGLTPTQTSLGASLVGGTHNPGVYHASSSLGVSGLVTLDGQGDPNAVFVFQIGSALTTASSARIRLTGAAQACNVFWQVSSSATLGTNNAFVGTIMALDSITVTTGTTVQGRALARNGAVTLDDNVFTDASCSTPVTPSSSHASTAPSHAPSTPAQHPSSAPKAAASAASASSAAAAAAAAALAAREAGEASGSSAAGGAAGSTGVGVGSNTTLLAATGVPKLGLLLMISAALLALGIGLLYSGRVSRSRRTRPAHRA